MTHTARTIRQLAGQLYGNGSESAGAEQAFWEALPTLLPDEVAALVRQVPRREQFGVMRAAVHGASPDRVEQLKARFSADELRAMVQA